MLKVTNVKHKATTAIDPFPVSINVQFTDIQTTI
jgi:hypothetical protein